MPIINQVVKGSGGGSEPVGIQYEIVNGEIQPSTTYNKIINFTGCTTINMPYILDSVYLNNTAISGTVNMSDVITIGSVKNCCSSMFKGCTGITGVNLNSLTTISSLNGCQYMFQYCTGIISVNISALTTISGGSSCASMFSGCTGLTSADFPALTTINGISSCASMFYDCTGLTSANLSSLTTIIGSSACSTMFGGCKSLATVYIGNTTAIDFGTQTNQFNNMFGGCTQNIDVYAPAGNQAQIEAFSGYPNFGAIGNVVWHWNS